MTNIVQGVPKPEIRSPAGGFTTMAHILNWHQGTQGIG
ncbi:hypothetical protein AAULH_14116, partial [Lactobacillus helveticus MTCC 5463]